jgi:two-component system, NtrC family, sensor histidine kinase PilS
MFSLDEKFLSANATPSSVQTLILGRLVLIFLLFVITWFWYTRRLAFSIGEFPQSILLGFTVSVGLTIIYFFLLRLSKKIRWQIRMQFALDAVMITWLVWRTGDLSSPFIVLYIVLISVSSIFLRPFTTLVFAFICIGLFASLTILASLSIIESTGAELTAAKIAQGVSFHVVAFLVVGLLAARLADRRSSGDELKEATKNLANLRALHERIIESIRSGLVTTDLEGNIYTYNAAATEITGFRAEEMQGRKIESLFGDISLEIEQSLGAVADGEQLPRFEANLLTPEGFAVRIGYSISQLFSEDNEATGLIITFQDLTEIRSMEESVRRKDRLAAVGRVGAGLAHEIRNPLGAMRGAIQVLESNMPAESIHADLMGIILRESDRLNSIITNFLSYAKPTVGKFQEIDVCEAIRDTIKLLRHSPDVNAGHVLEDLLPARPVFISADGTQLKQIFWNLARNAIQAMPDGGKLSIKLDPISNNRIRIVFEDSGTGMSPEAVEQLFEPFSNSTSGGTGLGLSIVYQIIRDHSGTINVRSIEGEGSVITVELPSENRRRAISDPGDDIENSVAPNRLKGLLKLKNEESEVSS